VPFFGLGRNRTRDDKVIRIAASGWCSIFKYAQTIFNRVSQPSLAAISMAANMNRAGGLISDKIFTSPIPLSRILRTIRLACVVGKTHRSIVLRPAYPEREDKKENHGGRPGEAVINVGQHG
jgi:hypothetical protein